ncbi:alpha/beta hydrolase [Shouchella patagoniensis]|uniref:alpha/beta hydrolase n=1 Tax=Shouchella patagoniensis TaxID=228576 RepID=UPI000995548F|nr:alpha/beta hydrolase [Shouchella patagoniensis]
MESQREKHTVYEEVLHSITKEHGMTDGSWIREWSKQGDIHRKKHQFIQACQCYNFARFPFVDGPERKDVQTKCVDVFQEWLLDQQLKVEKETIYFNGNEFSVYLSSQRKASNPLLIVMGGIVSIKEQWHQFLMAGPKMGFTVALAECPGVGENSLVYDEKSHGMIGAIMDQLAGRVNVNQTYFVGMSFGGQLGIKQAITDKRIQGITTVGAPVYQFYNEPGWLEQLPLITLKTLAHLTEIPEEEIVWNINHFAISKSEMTNLKIPVHYVFSNKDEIIPLSEKEFLKKHVAQLELIEFDDVHGSPKHMPEIQKYIPLSVMRQQKSNRILVRWMLAFLLGIQKEKRKLKSRSETIEQEA